jgi:hypothetical protein
VFLTHHGYGEFTMTDLAPIHAMLAAKEGEIRDIDSQREVLCRDAEMLRDVLRAMGDPTMPPKVEKKVANHPPTPTKKRIDSRAGTRLSDEWRAAMAKLAEADGEFTYDQVIAARGGNIEKNLARTKIGDFKKRGLVAGTKKPGFFVLTDQGRQIATEYVESTKPKDQPPPAPASAAPAAPVAAAPTVAAAPVPAAPVSNQAIGAPGVQPPSAPVAAPVTAQAAPVSGISNPSPAPGA